MNTRKTNDKICECEASKDAVDSLKYLLKVLEKSSEGVYITKNTGEISWANRAFELMVGKTTEAICKQGLEIYKEDQLDQNCLHEIIDKIEEHGEWEGNVNINSANGEAKSVYLRAFICSNPEDKYKFISFICKDITEDKKKEKIIYELEYIDTLTKLHNKNYLLKTIESTVASKKGQDLTVAVIYFDLSCFKTINDLQGRYVGDEILRYFTKQLKICAGTDNIVARVGGDEFAILIPSLQHVDDVYKITNQLIENLNIPVTINKQEIFITFSAGICIYPEDTLDAEEILHYADIAMHNAKNEKNKSIVRFATTMKDSLDDFFNISNHLRSAIEKNELFLNYQPIFDIPSGKMVGAEVLLRWNSEVLGLIPPSKFIPIAEATGQIIDIGEWVLREACRQSVEWYKAGFDKIPLAINVSIKQLEFQEFMQRLEAILNETGIDTKYLEIEITESISPENFDLVAETLLQIKMLGIKISIDDFGTGYSSLARLKAMAINKLKIDRAFINDIEDNEENGLVSSIISLGQSMNLKLVAEGIETEKQLNYLKLHKCQLGQGYLFSRPVNRDVFEDKLLVSYKLS